MKGFSSTILRKAAIGILIGGSAGIALILLIGLLSFFVDCKDWQKKDFVEFLTILGYQEFFAFFYYGILFIPLCSLAGILIAIGRGSPSQTKSKISEQSVTDH
jgi:hypothetical protein